MTMYFKTPFNFLTMKMLFKEVHHDECGFTAFYHGCDEIEHY